MTSKLSRERVLEEIDQLDGEVRALTRRIGGQRNNLPLDVQEDLDELEESVILARQFTSSNILDFRRVELGLMQLRQLKADVLNSINGSEI